MKITDTFDPTEENYRDLVSRVKKDNENLCRDGLVNFCQVLAFKHNVRLESVITEYTHSGGSRSDLILCGVSTAIPDGYNKELTYLDKEIIIYELKSPNASIVKNKTKAGIYLQSEEWIEATSQLTAYEDNLNNDNHFRTRTAGAVNMKVSKGGIIIGKQIPYSSKEDGEKIRSAQQHKAAQNFNCFSWDEVLTDIRDYFSL